MDVLNKFDTLTNSISEGLPKEIALRQKQYEYYRQVLLGFEKSNQMTDKKPQKFGKVFKEQLKLLKSDYSAINY